MRIPPERYVWPGEYVPKLAEDRHHVSYYVESHSNFVFLVSTSLMFAYTFDIPEPR